MIPAVSTLIHLEHDGKTARLSLQSLPSARPKPVVRMKTSKGEVTLNRVINGINPHLDPLQLQSTDLLEADPELNLDRAGYLVQPDMISTTYYDPAAKEQVPVSDFKMIDIILDAEGQEKDQRPHITRKSNLNDLMPVKIGKRIPIEKAFTSFIFKHTYQIVHEDGLTMDFLFKLASDLAENQEVALLGAGAKGNQPLVVRDKGSPYRGFLYGEVGSGMEASHYKLLLLLSDQELKKPEHD